MSQEPWREAALHDALRHLVLPSLVLAVVPTTEVIRHVRSSLIDVMKQNYIKAAASRGLSRRQIVWRHGLKNALPPVLPLLGLPSVDGDLRTAAVLSAAMPMLGIYSILAQRHGFEGFTAAALLATTAASFFTLSAILWLMRHSAGWLA